MAKVRGVLLDLDGVLYVGGVPIPGAREALARLRSRQLPVRFITNTTRRPRRVIRDELLSLGLAIADEELITPARAASLWLKERGLRPHLLIHPDLAEDFAEFRSDGTEAVVVGDAGEGFTYGALNQAFRLVIAGAPLVALARNRYFRESDGLSLDAGPFVAALEVASGARAELVGKPAPGLFRAAVVALGCAPAEAVMVGDDVEADVNGALAAGLQAMLVQTGKFRAEDAARLQRGAALVADVRAAVERILEAADA